MKISEFMEFSREQRRSHLDLNEPCLEMCESAANIHHVCRGILAYFLGTTVPFGRMIYACHACNNRRCSNPKHMYWGTPADNLKDQIENGTFATLPVRMIEKLGENGWRAASRLAAAKGGRANAGKRKALKPVPPPPRRGNWSTGSRKGIKMPRPWSRRRRA